MFEVVLATNLLLGAGKIIAEATMTDAVSDAIRNGIAQTWGKDNVVNHDLQKAMHTSLKASFAVIKVGLEGKAWFKHQEEKQQKFLEEFEEKYLSDFDDDERKQAAKWCKKISKNIEKIFPLDDDIINVKQVSNILLSAQEGFEGNREEAQKEIITRISDALDIHSEKFFKLLKQDHLLLDNIIFYFHEEIKTNPRVTNILAHFDRQNILAEIKIVEEKLGKAFSEKNYTQMANFSQAIEDWNKVAKNLEAERAEAKRYFEKLERDLGKYKYLIVAEITEAIGEDGDRTRKEIKKLNSKFEELQHATTEQLKSKDLKIERLQQQLIQQAKTRQKFSRKSVGNWQNVDKFFVDRIAYLDRLANNIVNDTKQLILIIGQGGIGKTAITAKLCTQIEKEGYKLKLNKIPETPIRAIVYIKRDEMISFTMDQVFDKLLEILDAESQEKIMPAIRDPKMATAQKTNLILDCLKDETAIIIFDNFESILMETKIKEPALKEFIETVCSTRHKAKLILTTRRNVEIDHFEAVEPIHLNEGLDYKHAIEFLRLLSDGKVRQIENATDEQLTALAQKVYGVPMALRSLVGFLKNNRRLKIDDLIEDEEKYEDFKEHDHTIGLRKLIKEQYGNLPDEAKLALQILAVYNKPVQPVAVQHILPAMNAEEILDSLAFDYFLAQEHNDYFEIHPTVQEYAYEQIPRDQTSKVSETFEVGCQICF